MPELRATRMAHAHCCQVLVLMCEPVQELATSCAPQCASTGAPFCCAVGVAAHRPKQASNLQLARQNQP